MPRLVFAPHALDDLDRLTDFLLEQSPELDAATAPHIVSGLEALKLHPLLGRPVEHGLREVLLSRGRTGYVALYQYDAATDVVLVLAVRHQREAGFREL
ncbi:MAG: type II toxin-antitoxin system RelE/ParE family toxin [Betaproteobacteria bacterium]|nr:MAG: type II toxin-antitoxin system RelE/ParE family toxin [Betaproteobacteria bacterium]